MELLMTLIDKGEELLGHSLHPALVSAPLGAWTVSVISDGLGWACGDVQFDDAARVSMAIGLVGAAGAVVTGLHDYSYIPRQRQPSHSIATRHGIGNAVVGALFATSYILRIRAGRDEEPPAMARLLCFAGGALMAYTAWLGGKLVEEQGEAVKPVIKQHDEAHT